MENEKETQQTQQIQGWKDVQINGQLPLEAILNFFNILNQRLCTVEDLTKVSGPDGSDVTLTELYRLQTEEQMKQAQAKAEETKEETTEEQQA